MKARAFTSFCEEVRAASYTSPIWYHYGDYWTGMTDKQSRVMGEILDSKPEVVKLERNGAPLYILPGGREWCV